MKFHFVGFHLENEEYSFRGKYFKEGTNLKTAAERTGHKLCASCGGAGMCKKCLVIADGKEVLACQAKVEEYEKVCVPQYSLRSSGKQAVVVTKNLLSCKQDVSESRRAQHRFGVAADIGTTTLAAELHCFSEHRFDEHSEAAVASRPNPQRQFGDDVLSRIKKVMDEPAALKEMQQLVAGALNEMIAELAEKAGITPPDISLVTAAGNSVMQLLLHGIDPSPLGTAPFHPPVSEFPPRPASEVGLNIAENGILETLPLFGGFVGGDLVAGILALHNAGEIQHNAGEIQHNANEAVLFIDIGTNGEIVLFHQGRLYTAATAAGPAFEGARIEFGMQAAPGAVDSVALDGERIRVSTIKNAKAVGICGSGLIDAVAVLLGKGIIKANGKLLYEGERYFELVPAEQSGIGKAVLLTQRDVRQVQLAAGAVRTGIMLLLESAGLRGEDLKAFYIAGGFGQFINILSAQRIGLIPKEIPFERLKTCGNTSLYGARLLLLEPQYAETAKQYVAQSRSIELAALPHFAEVFADSMNFS
ncbi:MAG: ASKHA domain-containing protein [Planctomycetaceae bacterium]|jgi:uncharacterized 2Fe-2S/4Fe-4S cluster protein (DUF4445 family)|nr:ASKHA domain-containing protein [Planctomycetaceae bacterium]